MSGFRASGWDPSLIVGQIICLQASYYLSLSVVLSLLHLLSAAPWSVDPILLWQSARLDTALGWGIVFGNLVAAGSGCFLLMVVVERTKLCLDFACTLHFFHFVLTAVYSGSLPRSFSWIAQWLISCAIMTIGGEYLCMRRDLEPITISGGGLGAKRKHSARTMEHGADVELLAAQSAEENGSSQNLDSDGRTV